MTHENCTEHNPRKITLEILDPRNLEPKTFDTQEKWDPRNFGHMEIETHKIAGDPGDLANSLVLSFNSSYRKQNLE